MGQIYGMESPIDTTQAQIMWGSHVSMIKWGSLTLTQQKCGCYLTDQVRTLAITVMLQYFCMYFAFANFVQVLAALQIKDHNR